MGQSYNKQEEVFIAQNGANQASYSSLESSIKTYGILTLGIAIAIGIVIMCWCCGTCRARIRKQLKKEVGDFIQKAQMDQTV